MSEFIGLGSFFVGLAIFLFSMGLLILLVEILSPRKSQKYRKEITDMFVAAKTRVLAKADSLDLEKETETFKEWARKERTRTSTKDLDDTIEQELREKVSAPIKKK